MYLKVGQIFTREIARLDTEPNTYLICGIIKTDRPLECEATHIISGGPITIYESKSVEDVSRGNGLDGIMTEGIWKVKLKKEER